MVNEARLFGFPSFPIFNSEPIIEASSKIYHVVKSIFTSLRNSPDALLNGLELLRNGAQIYDRIKNIPELLSEFNLSLNSFGYAFYTLRLPFFYLEYFLHSIKNDEPLSAIGNVLYFFSDVGSSLAWFNDLKVFDLAKLSQQIGKVRVIGAVVKIPLNSVISLFCGFAYIFFGMDAIVRLSRGTLDRGDRLLAWLDIANSIIQVVLMCLVLFSGVTAPVILGLTLVSGSISVITFGIRYGKLLRSS